MTVSDLLTTAVIAIVLNRVLPEGIWRGNPTSSSVATT